MFETFTELEIVEAKEFCENYAYKYFSGEWTKEKFKEMLFDHMTYFRADNERFKKVLDKAQCRWQELMLGRKIS